MKGYYGQEFSGIIERSQTPDLGGLRIKIKVKHSCLETSSDREKSREHPGRKHRSSSKKGS